MPEQEPLPQPPAEGRTHTRAPSLSFIDLLPDMEDESGTPWQDRANCLNVDPDLFFPERGASTSEAKEVCRGCEVREECLEYALSTREKWGIWGGLTERERRRELRVRALARRTLGAN